MVLNTRVSVWYKLVPTRFSLELEPYKGACVRCHHALLLSKSPLPCNALHSVHFGADGIQLTGQALTKPSWANIWIKCINNQDTLGLLFYKLSLCVSLCLPVSVSVSLSLHIYLSV